MSIFSIFTNRSKAPASEAKEPKKVVAPKPPKKAVVPAVDQATIQAAIQTAQAQAREIILEAKDEALKLKDLARQEANQIRKSVETEQQQAFTRRQELAQLQAKLEERERLTRQQADSIQKKIIEIEELEAKQIKALEKVSSLTVQEAKARILEQVEKQSYEDIAKIIKGAEEKANEEAETKAREILVDAMFAGATDYVAEYTVSIVRLPDEETKGRIIGKDGRNIRTFEKVTGVDVDLDENGVIKLSCFDSVRREIARVALERLIRDGRIHPTHIEEYVAKAKRDLEQIMYREGEKLCHAVSVYNVPKDLVAMLGRFKYRTSYGQNMIAHTLEETKIGMKLASEVGANLEVVKLGCLFHDIGKVIADQEGSHVELGVKLLKKYSMPQAVIDCVAQHHEDEEFSRVESVVVYIADAISGSRPGARYENYEEYVERLQKLEAVATKHPGVKEAFAIQAGREVRVIVEPEKITDAEAIKLAADIKNEVQSSMTYPGTVKITVIRETRASQVAN